MEDLERWSGKFVGNKDLICTAILQPGFWPHDTIKDQYLVYFVLCFWSPPAAEGNIWLEFSNHSPVHDNFDNCLHKYRSYGMNWWVMTFYIQKGQRSTSLWHHNELNKLFNIQRHNSATWTVCGGIKPCGSNSSFITLLALNHCLLSGYIITYEYCVIYW